MISCALLAFLCTACQMDQPKPRLEEKMVDKPAVHPKKLLTSEQWKQRLREKYQHQKPKEWAEKVPGVLTRLPTNEKKVALTLDACGGPNGSGYDRELIEYLRKENIPATLFVNARWIRANEKLFLELAKDPLFEIANHGTEHRPLSINGRSIYGIRGTQNVNQLVEEVWENHLLITRLTGKEPRYFRSGTAYYDELAVQIVKEMGEEVAHFDVIGDGGATFSREQVIQAMLSVKPGSIVILHMNQPNSDTAEGVKYSIPILKKRGFQFVKLGESS